MSRSVGSGPASPHVSAGLACRMADRIGTSWAISKSGVSSAPHGWPQMASLNTSGLRRGWCWLQIKGDSMFAVPHGSPASKRGGASELIDSKQRLDRQPQADSAEGQCSSDFPGLPLLLEAVGASGRCELEANDPVAHVLRPRPACRLVSLLHSVRYPEHRRRRRRRRRRRPGGNPSLVL